MYGKACQEILLENSGEAEGIRNVMWQIRTRRWWSAPTSPISVPHALFPSSTYYCQPVPPSAQDPGSRPVHNREHAAAVCRSSGARCRVHAPTPGLHRGLYSLPPPEARTRQVQMLVGPTPSPPLGSSCRPLLSLWERPVFLPPPSDSHAQPKAPNGVPTVSGSPGAGPRHVPGEPLTHRVLPAGRGKRPCLCSSLLLCAFPVPVMRRNEQSVFPGGT